MTDTIYNLRYTDLGPLAMKLHPFIYARRPHDKAPTWRDLKAEGLERVEDESLMDIIEDQYIADQEKVTNCTQTL